MEKIESKATAIEQSQEALNKIIEADRFVVAVGTKSRNGVTVHRVMYDWQYEDVPDFMRHILTPIIRELLKKSEHVDIPEDVTEMLPPADISELMEGSE